MTAALQPASFAPLGCEQSTRSLHSASALKNLPARSLFPRPPIFIRFFRTGLPRHSVSLAFPWRLAAVIVQAYCLQWLTGMTPRGLVALKP